MSQTSTQGFHFEPVVSYSPLKVCVCGNGLASELYYTIWKIVTVCTFFNPCSGAGLTARVKYFFAQNSRDLNSHVIFRQLPMTSWLLCCLVAGSTKLLTYRSAQSATCRRKWLPSRTRGCGKAVCFCAPHLFRNVNQITGQWFNLPPI